MVRGDWVVYETDGERRVGRVWKLSDDGEDAFVCYTTGCTASRTPLEMLRPYDRDADSDLTCDAWIGHYRFQGSCPDYDSSICGGCKVPIDIVRCRDCVNYRPGDGGHAPRCRKSIGTFAPGPDGFCAWGKRG